MFRIAGLRGRKQWPRRWERSRPRKGKTVSTVEQTLELSSIPAGDGSRLTAPANPAKLLLLQGAMFLGQTVLRLRQASHCITDPTQAQEPHELAASLHDFVDDVELAAYGVGL